MYSDRNATMSGAKRRGSAGMDRRPNAARVSSPAVWPGWIAGRTPRGFHHRLFGRDGSPAERRVGFITGCLAGMDRRPFPERGASTAETPERKGRGAGPPDPHPFLARERRVGFITGCFGRDASTLVSGAGRKHRGDPGAEGTGGGGYPTPIPSGSGTPRDFVHRLLNWLVRAREFRDLRHRSRGGNRRAPRAS